MPVTIATIVGSLRAGSVNAEMAAHVSTLGGDRAVFVDVPIGDVPHYNQDLDVEGDHPPAVAAMKSAVADADGVIVFSPEYNHSIPGVVKNAIDWISRPFLQSPAMGTPFGIAVSGPARHEMTGLQEHLAHTAEVSGFAVHGPVLVVNSINHRRDDDGGLDDATRALVDDWLDGFLTAAETAVEAAAADEAATD